MLPRLASALLLLLAVGGAAPPLAAQDTVPSPELAALPLDSLLGRMTRNDAAAGGAAFHEAVRRARPDEIAPYLRAENERLATVAVYVLMGMGQPGAGVLVEGLHGADERRRRHILSVLDFGSVDERVAQPVAAALLREEDEELRIAGARMLQRSAFMPGDTVADPEAEALVLAALADPSGNVRAAAADALNHHLYISPSEVRALIGLLAHDPEPEVRATAALTLGLLGHDGAPAVPALIAAMADPDETVRWRSASALGELGLTAVDAVPVLVQASRANDDELRYAAVASLGDIGIDPPVQAGPVLRALEEALAHEDSTTRWMAVGSLANLDTRAVPLLVRALRDPGEQVASEAAAALGRRPVTQPVVDALFAALRHPRTKVGAAAAEALAGFGPAQLPRLREAARAGSQPAAWAVRYVEQGDRLGIAGACYAFRRGPWQPPMELGLDSVFSTPPAQVRFLPTLAGVAGKDDGGPGEPRFVAERLGPSAWPAWRNGTWRPAPEGQALEMGWSNGFSGVALDLRVEEGGTMRGTARTFWDFGREPQTAEVTADRIPCPAEDSGAE
ncbi:MAG TPA: HEAT repeat domain-containing protein [Longimicrobium sp.]|nr:HEAT repeat domain-containing protein [Longimicrobium sp.]